MTYEIVTNAKQDLGLTWAVDQFNAQVDIRNAAAPKDEKGDPINPPEAHVTAAGYLGARVGEVLDSYYKEKSRVQAVAAYDAKMTELDAK